MVTLLPMALMLMQVGIDPRGGSVPGVPPELRDRPPRGAAPPRIAPAAAPPARLRACLEGAGAAPASTIADARQWLAAAKGADRAYAGHCLGVAQTEAGDWNGAAASFSAATEAVPADNRRYRSQLASLAGAAALAAGDATRALALLDRARSDAGADPRLTSDIAVDRARALVALGRLAEARSSLTEARTANAIDPEAWLLSATLSRRANALDTAQGEIERAAALAPGDPAIGLEAGVIAALAGRDAAARRSFESVITLAPQSAEAAAARGYLTQLGKP